MARRLNTRNDEETRAKIQTTQLIKRLYKHVCGEIKLSSTQVRAAEILLNKTIPNLQAVEWTGELTHRHVKELSDDELLAIASGGSGRASEAETGKRKPSQVH